MHETYIEANWDEIHPEWFDVGCEHCKFSSLGHTTFEAATRVAEGHEALAPVPSLWRPRRKPQEGPGDVCIPVPCRGTIHVIEAVREARSMTTPLSDDELKEVRESWLCTSKRWPGAPFTVIALLDEVEASRKKLAAADTFGTNLVIALNDYSAKLQAITDVVRTDSDDWSDYDPAGMVDKVWRILGMPE